MTPEFLQRVDQVYHHCLSLPDDKQQDFLEHLRSWAPDMTSEVERRLQQLSGDVPSSNQAGILDSQLLRPKESQPLPTTITKNESDVARTQDSSPNSSGSASASGVSTLDYHVKKSSQAKSSNTAPESQLPDFVPAKVGRFETVNLIDKGGMGAVLRAYDPELDRTLAVKVMLPHSASNPQLRALFLRETRITGQLQHPGIPPIHDLGQLEDGLPYFGMKLIEGTTLAKELNKREALSREMPRFLGVFEQICQTLSYAHSRGVIHRDLKPQNVMVGAFGEVQVMDWGLAKFVNRSDSTEYDDIRRKSQDFPTSPKDSQPTGTETVSYHPRPETNDPQDLRQSLSNPGSVMGTLPFMAPEQGRGENKELDERCDVFGLGAILCVILTGAPPFHAKGQKALMRQVEQGELTEAWTRLYQCQSDKEIVDLCRACLAPKKEDRPRDGSELAERVTKYLESVQERLRQVEIQKRELQVRTQEERKRRRIQLALVVVALAFFLGLASVGFWYQKYLNQRAKENEQKVAQLKQFLAPLQDLHKKFDETTKKKNGVFELLNHPDQWTKELQQARATLQTEARKRLTRIEGKPAQDLEEQLDQLERDLAQDQKDWELVLTLGDVRERKMMIVGDQLNLQSALESYPEAFQKMGLDVWKYEPRVLANRIRKMRTKDQIIASVYDWAYVASDGYTRARANTHQKAKKRYGQLLERLLKIVSLADDERWAKRLHNPNLWYKWLGDPKALEKLIRSMPKDASPHLFVLTGNFAPKKTSARKSWLELATDRYPRDFTVNFDIATRVSIGAPKEALGYFRTARNINPESSTLYVNWGLALHDLERHEQAIEKFKKAVTLNKNYAGAYTGWGNVLSDLGRHDEAIEKQKKAIALDKNFATAYANWGKVLSDLGQYEEAIEKYQKAIHIDEYLVIGKNLANTYDNWGVALYDLGRYEEAIEKYNKATNIDKNFASAYTNWGNALGRLKRYTEAIKKYKKATAVDKNDAPTYYNWGIVLDDLRRYEEAIEKYKKATTINKNYAKAYYNWGIALDGLRRYEKSVKKYQKATTINKNFASAYTN